MAAIEVRHLDADAFRIDIRGHRVLVDQPAGGAEAGPTPLELFVASLASCAAHYAVGYLREHGLAHEGLRVECEWKLRATQPARVSRLAMKVTLPATVPPAARTELLAAIDACTVHNSLRQPPEVVVALDEPVSAGV